MALRSPFGLCLTAVVVTVLAWLAPRPTVPSGLAARYFASADWSGTAVAERIDTDISTDALAVQPVLQGLSSFSVEWSGYLVVQTAGLHRFATKSDDGSWLWIDDRLVIENGGIHPVRNVTADVLLARGVHPIRIRYMQGGGEQFLQLGQASSGGAFLPIGPLVPENRSYWELRARELWPLALVLLWYVTLARLLWLGLRRSQWVPHLQALADAARDRTFLAIALLGLAASVAHIAYGLPAYDAWSGDELAPLSTLEASQTAFRNWNLRWPTLHMHLMTLVLQPFEWASALFGLPLADRTVNAGMFIVVRGLSVLMLFATLLLTFDAAAMITDRMTGYFAVALLATMPVVVYFGSLANLEIPQMFWATLAFWSWLRFLRRCTLASSIVFGIIVGLSLACKDQLYGFYLAAPLAVAYVLVRDRGAPVSFLAAVVDRRFMAIGMATVVGFAIGHQLPFEWERFTTHVRSMTTVDSVPFRMFTHSVAGNIGLLMALGRSFVWAAGVPAAIVSVLGCAYLALSGRVRLLGSLFLPLITYYVGFLVVILYVYDRFLIAFLPIAAILGGMFLSAVVRATWGPRAFRIAVPAVAFAGAAANAVAINAVFTTDPRHQGTEWIANNLACGSSVGVTYNAGYVPPLDCYNLLRLTGSTVDAMTRYPDYLVFNEAFVRRFQRTPSGSRFMARLEAGELGYQRVFRAEARPPRWAPLYWEERFSNAEEDAETILDKPLHAIEVWKKR